MSNSKHLGKAVIYCRVSSAKQVSEGNGLDTQEMRCRSFAKGIDYEVVKVFRDEAISGTTHDRKGFSDLLKFLDKNKTKNKKIVVIADDIARLARDVEIFHTYKAEIKKREAEILFTNQKNDDSPEGRFSENIQASAAQYERDSNRRRVITRQTARLQEGYWVYAAPIGYKFPGGKDKIIRVDETYSGIIIELYEGFASGRFQTYAEATSYLQTIPVVQSRYKSRKVHKDLAKTILTNFLYAGHIQKLDLGISLTPAKHQAIISLQLFQIVQDIISGKKRVNVPFRKDNNESFPLRGFINCACCDLPLTASFSKGRKGYHAYYRCKSSPKACYMGGKSVRKELIEADFVRILESSKPAPQVLKLAKCILAEVHQTKMKTFQADLKRLEAQLKELAEDKQGIIKKLARTENAALVREYEKHLADLTVRETALQNQIEMAETQDTSLGTAFKTLSGFLQRPVDAWVKGNYDQKRNVLKMIFAEKLNYHQKTGFGTAAKSMPFRLIALECDKKEDMVDPSGIEPLTSTMPLWRSPS